LPARFTVDKMRYK